MNKNEKEETMESGSAQEKENSHSGFLKLQSQKYCCSICSSISMALSQCKGCQQFFCDFCVENWKKQSNSCPFKCSQWILDQVSTEIINEIKNLNFQCQNQTKGCDISLKLCDLEDHEQECQVGLTSEEIIVLLRTKIKKLEDQIRIISTQNQLNKEEVASLKQVISLSPLKTEVEESKQKEQQEQNLNEKNTDLNFYLDKILLNCRSGHNFQKVQEYKISKFSSNSTPCQICLSTFDSPKEELNQKAFLFCQQCQTRICVDCEQEVKVLIEKKHQIKDRVVCFNGHETDFLIQNQIHPQYFPGKGYLCNTCNKPIQTYENINQACFRCEFCNFDECFNCNQK